jgi:hypothetical protein
MIRYGREITYPDAYDDVVKLMPRLEKKGLVKRHPKVSKYLPTIWSHPGLKDIKTIDDKQHELDCMDLYVAFWKSFPDGMQYWDWRWQPDERHSYETYKKDGFNFDARMKYKGDWFFLEVDRGTKTLEQLEDQVMGYILFSKKVPEPYFRVIFTLQFERYGFTYSAAEKHKQVNKRARFLLELFDKHKTGERFLVARHAEVLTDPLGPVLVSPLDPSKPKAIDNLVQRSKAS